MPATETGILGNPGTHWRTETADRLALLVDGAAYFSALAAAMEQARHSITILGWDIRSDLLLEPERSAETFAERCRRLLDATPGLHIRLLVWDWIVTMSLDREVLPQWRLAPLHDRLDFVLDDSVPVGAALHEKVAVIDGSLAFVGGIDLSAGRWDTPAHDPESHHRRPANGGETPAPFHDLMLLVDGAAGRAVGELAVERWQRATDERITLAPDAARANWPKGVGVDVEGQRLAIARTRPRYAEAPEVREIEALYLASIEAAERLIYIENQYLTVPKIAQALARRLRAQPELEVVIVTPDECEGPLETAVMDQGRKAFVATLEAATDERLVVLTTTSHGVAVNIHAKLMIVDDRFMTMGSANLANRSMGVDSEINLAIEHSEADAVIRGWRLRLMGEHLGVEPAILAETEETRGSTIAAIAALNDLEAERHCRPLHLADAEFPAPLDDLAEIADPPEPIIADKILGPLLPLRDRRRVRRWSGRVAALAGVAVVIAAWRGPLVPLVSLWLALPLGLLLIAFWVAAERLWRPGLR